VAKKIYMCPHCNVQVRYLKRHIARMHPETLKTKTKREATPKTKGKKLELKTPLKKSLEKAVEQGYHCVDCGGSLTKGQTPCPGCGATLDWRGL